MNKKIIRKDFYEIKRIYCRKSIFLFLILTIFYFMAVGVIILSLFLSLGLFFPFSPLSFEGFRTKFLLINIFVSSLIAFFHFHDARKNGARFILRRLGCQSPDPEDRYHQKFVNSLEEMRIASGLPRAEPLLIPSFAINSLTVVDSHQVPYVAVTEGLLAEATREELEAIAAHELAHVSSGDALYVTLVCSLVNFFERVRESLEAEEAYELKSGKKQRSRAPQTILSLALGVSSFLMHFLSMFLSRERELLADAQAVELCRNPAALARAIYRAQIKNSFVGDFALTYSPIFIVSPEPPSESENFFSNLFNSHPPLMKRIGLLARMANLNVAKIVDEVWRITKEREKARVMLKSAEEREFLPSLFPEEIGEEGKESKIWLIRNREGKWEGPYTLEELFSLPFFSPLITLKNIQENVEGRAREFRTIREALRIFHSKSHPSPWQKNRCPRCRAPLQDTFYEGVKIKLCPHCQGKLIAFPLIERILCRREVAFSEGLFQKAAEFRKRFLLNPVKMLKDKEKFSAEIYCPQCGYKMITRPYSYQYFVPVDKCLSCGNFWFEADELEILQILLENNPENSA